MISPRAIQNSKRSTMMMMVVIDVQTFKLEVRVGWMRMDEGLMIDEGL